MKYEELKSKMVKNRLTTQKLVDALNKHGMDIALSTMYLKLRGINEFTRPEIQMLKEVLHLSDAEVMDIFFDGEETK